jgi:5-methyltetrahydropteroyltriglutamate--homocysteine methyltransferase
MVQSYDVGSFPFFGDLEKLVKGAKSFEEGVNDESASYFKKTIVNAFLDKLAAGVDVPNFPQFRDMDEMFLSMIDGLERLREGYVETAPLALKSGGACLAEVLAIKNNAQVISEKSGASFRMKVCVTGPYTLASFFPCRDGALFGRLGEVLSRIVEANLFREKTGCVGLVSIDEPLFGLVDDPLVDRGSVGQENLLKAWSGVFHSAKTKNVPTCLHLHATMNDLFWSVEDLDIIESHVDDSLYRFGETKRLLEKEDKFLKASACKVDFDWLIRNAMTKASSQRFDDSALSEAVAETWQKIQKGVLAPEGFLETIQIMRKRVVEVVERFGVERVPYVGPECGLRGFPSYECAVECLRRVAEVGRSFRV